MPLTNDAHKLPGFLKRQIVLDATTKRKIFDVIAGIIMPVICIWADPFIFKGAEFPLLKSFHLWGYSQILIGIVGLTLALTGQRKSSYLAGLLFAGGIFSICLGCLLLPFSLFGIRYYGYGLLGFTPFLTGFVFLRNAIRVHKRGTTTANRNWRVALCALACMIWLLIPVAAHSLANYTVSKQIDIIISGRPEQVRAASRRLKRLRYFAEFDAIVWKHERISNPNRKKVVAEAYKEITGRDIQIRRRMLLEQFTD